MTTRKRNTKLSAVEAVAGDRDLMKALVAALAGMYVQGVSTRKVKAITGELCGHSFSASAISAINKGLTEAPWQRCYVHFLRNAQDYLPRKADDDCLQELRWLYDRRDIQEANRDLAAWIAKWQGRYPKLVDRVESYIAGTLTFYR